MENIVTALNTSLSLDVLNGTFQAVIPWLATSVLFGLIVYLVKRIVNKVKRAKGGM